MKKTVLLRLGVLVEVDPDGDSRELVRIMHRLHAAIDQELGCQDNRVVGCQSNRPLELDDPGLNCGRCAVCGGWVTDCARPDRIPELCNGAVVDGQLLCDDHLPPDHRWAF